MAASNETLRNMAETTATIEDGFPFIGGFCALLLRTSFLFIQLGCMPVPDLKMLVFQNVVDLASGTVAYCLLGFSFAYGRDVGGFAGADRFFMADLGNGFDAVRGWAAGTTTSGLFTLGVAGRLHPVGAAVSSAWLCAISAALLQHWAWNEGGWCRHDFSFVDNGGAGPVHVCGGAAALVGVLALGRRVLRVRDVDECSLPPGSGASVVGGYLLAIVGYAGLAAINHPSMSGVVFVNVVVAAAGGWAAAALFGVRSETLDHWTLLRVAQGGVSGCVMVVAGAGLYSAPVSLLLGFLGGALSCASSYIWDSTALEDNVCVVPCSLLCGFLGTLAVPVGGRLASLDTSRAVMTQFGRQFLCTTAMLATTLILHSLICLILMCLGLFRNRAELAAHKRALSALNHTENRPFFRRLFSSKKSRVMQPGYRDKGLAIASGSNLLETNPLPKTLHQIPTGSNAKLGDLKPNQQRSHTEKTKNREAVKKNASINRTRHFRKARQRRKRFVHTLSNLRKSEHQNTEVVFENEKMRFEDVRGNVAIEEEESSRCVSVVEAEVYEQPSISKTGDENTKHTVIGQIESNSCPELDYLVYRKYESLLQRASLEKCVSYDEAESSRLIADVAISMEGNCQIGQCTT